MNDSNLPRKAVLKHDVKGAFSPYRIYGRAGDEVKIISGEGRAFVVEGPTGYRYPVAATDFTDDPGFVPPPPSPMQEPAPGKKVKTKAPTKSNNNQSSLF